MARVPTPRLGMLGIQQQSHQAPTVTLSAYPMIPITNAQYPHPIWASAIATTVYTARATTALAETALNRILRFNSAMCISEIAVIKIATAISEIHIALLKR